MVSYHNVVRLFAEVVLDSNIIKQTNVAVIL